MFFYPFIVHAQTARRSRSAGFSLWGLVLARTKTHRLKPALLELQHHACEWWLDVGYVPRVNLEWESLLLTIVLSVQSKFSDMLMRGKGRFCRPRPTDHEVEMRLEHRCSVPWRHFCRCRSRSGGGAGSGAAS